MSTQRNVIKVRCFSPVAVSLLAIMLLSLLLTGCMVRQGEAGPEIVMSMVAEEAPPEPEAPEPEPFMPSTDIIASGLLSPRQMHYDSDGTLYIAEAGIAGTFEVAINDESSVNVGLTSQVSAVAPDGSQSVVLPGLPSANRSLGNTGFHGVQDVLVTDDSYFVAIGETAGGFFLSFLYIVVEIDRDTWRVKNIIDTIAAASEIGQPDPDAVSSDPVDLEMDENGVLYITDAACNCLWTWTAEGGLTLFAAWPIDDNPVPTGTDFGPDGDVYVSFLSGFPFEVGSARIERYSPTGELKQTYGDLTLVTDVYVDDAGTIYAVEFAAGFDERGFIPDSGRVIVVTEDGITPVMEGLRTPYALAQAPDGSMVVSVVSAFDVDGNGMVIAVADQ